MKDRLAERYITAGIAAAFAISALSGVENPAPLSDQAKVLLANQVAVLPKPQDDSPRLTTIKV